MDYGKLQRFAMGSVSIIDTAGVTRSLTTSEMATHDLIATPDQFLWDGLLRSRAEMEELEEWRWESAELTGGKPWHRHDATDCGVDSILFPAWSFFLQSEMSSVVVVIGGRFIADQQTWGSMQVVEIRADQSFGK
jgi:hypothetical protein